MENENFETDWLNSQILELEYSIPVMEARNVLSKFNTGNDVVQDMAYRLSALTYVIPEAPTKTDKFKEMDPKHLEFLESFRNTSLPFSEKFLLLRSMFHKTYDRLVYADIMKSKGHVEFELAVLILHRCSEKKLLEANQLLYWLTKVQLFAIQHDSKNTEQYFFAEIGKKTQETLTRARQESSRTRKETSHQNQRNWRAMAIEIWQKNPGWTLDDMANWISQNQQTDRALGTIKNSLKGIKSAIHLRKDEL